VDKRHGRGGEQEIQGEYHQTLHYDNVEALTQHLYAYMLNYNFNLK